MLNFSSGSDRTPGENPRPNELTWNESWTHLLLGLTDARKRRNRPSGAIDSARAGVSNKPCATNAAKHGWIQNATKWFGRDEVRSR